MDGLDIMILVPYPNSTYSNNENLMHHDKASNFEISHCSSYAKLMCYFRVYVILIPNTAQNHKNILRHNK